MELLLPPERRKSKSTQGVSEMSSDELSANLQGAERLLTAAYRIENPPLSIEETRDANLIRLHQAMRTLHDLYVVFMERIYIHGAFDEITEYENLRDSVERCIYLLGEAIGLLNLDAQLDLAIQRT